MRSNNEQTLLLSALNHIEHPLAEKSDHFAKMQ